MGFGVNDFFGSPARRLSSVHSGDDPSLDAQKTDDKKESGTTRKANESKPTHNSQPIDNDSKRHSLDLPKLNRLVNGPNTGRYKPSKESTARLQHPTATTAASYAFELGNILSLPTRLVFFRRGSVPNASGPGERVEVRPKAFNAIRKLLGRKLNDLDDKELKTLRQSIGDVNPDDFLDNFELRPDDPITGSMQNFHDDPIAATDAYDPLNPEQNKLLAQIQEAIVQYEAGNSGKWWGTSFNAFLEALSRPETAAETYIMSMRGHSPESIRGAFEWLRINGYLATLDPSAAVKLEIPRGRFGTVLPADNIYPMAHPETVERLKRGEGEVFENTSLKNVAMKKQLDRRQLKAEAIKASGARMASICGRSGETREELLTWGISVDQWHEFTSARGFLMRHLDKWPDVKITLFYEGVLPEKHAGEPKNQVIVSKGVTRALVDDDLKDAARLKTAMLFRRYDWQPTQADEDFLAQCAVNARKENLLEDEKFQRCIFFSTPAADMKDDEGTNMYHGLLKRIEQQTIRGARGKIYAALYGLEDVPEVVEALGNAIAAGVDVKIVVDQMHDGTFTYEGTEEILQKFPENVRVERGENHFIMHNKFWLFGNNEVWTGSTNVSNSAIRTGYNNEISIAIKSKNLHRQFTAELAQMWCGKFHHAKQNVHENWLTYTNDPPVKVGVFFPPTASPVPSIIEAIQRTYDEEKVAEGVPQRIKLTLFHFSRGDLRDELIKAHKHGVEVELLIDASGASNAYTKQNIEALRRAGIPVKVENWGGKQHMKGGIIGDVYVTGSMNWSDAGETKNDENVLLIYGDSTLCNRVERDFNTKAHSLPTLSAFAYWPSDGFISPGSITSRADNEADFWAWDPDRRGSEIVRLHHNMALKRIEKAAIDYYSRLRRDLTRDQALDRAEQAMDQAMQIVYDEMTQVHEYYRDAQEDPSLDAARRLRYKKIAEEIDSCRGEMRHKLEDLHNCQNSKSLKGHYAAFVMRQRGREKGRFAHYVGHERVYISKG